MKQKRSANSGGKRGRGRPAGTGLSEKELLARGSRHGVQLKRNREKAERKKKARHAVARMPTRSNLERFCRTLLPGYDPWLGSAGYEFCVDSAMRAVRFFHTRLTHCKGALAGQPFKLTPVQMAIVGNAFGWLDAQTRLRRYRQVYISVAEKNGKTPLAAGIALKLLCDDDEPGSEVYGLAYLRDQAALVGQWARGMVAQDEWLSERLRILIHAIEVSDDRNAFYRVVACKEYGLHGVNMHGGVVDELHTFDKARGDAIDVLQKKMKARRQPMLVYITTAGFDRQSYCHELYAHGKAIIGGRLKNNRFLPVIFEADKELEWDSVEAIEQANPLLGVSVKLEDIVEERDRARKVPRHRALYERLNLNRWTDSETIWIPSDEWLRCGGPIIDKEELKGRRCYGGLDIGLTRDHTAFAICYPPIGPRDTLFRLFVWYWMPGDNIRDRSDVDGVDYWEWSEQGHMRLFDGAVTDFAELRADIVSICTEHRIAQVAYDPFKASQIVNDLENQDGLPMVVHRQGFVSMAAPTGEFERLALSGQLRHGDNPILEWNLKNTSIKTDPAGNKKPDKKKSTARIDGIVASIMAVGLATLNTKEKTSPYQNHGLRVI